MLNILNVIRIASDGYTPVGWLSMFYATGLLVLDWFSDITPLERVRKEFGGYVI